MKESISKGHQILSDGRTVWVNAPTGASLARLSNFGGRPIVDIHQSLAKQRETGNECLDCRHDLEQSEAWGYFTESVWRNFGVLIGESHRPLWTQKSPSRIP